MIFLLPAKIQKRSIMIFVILFVSYKILILKILEPNLLVIKASPLKIGKLK